MKTAASFRAVALATAVLPTMFTLNAAGPSSSAPGDPPAILSFTASAYYVPENVGGLGALVTVMRSGNLSNSVSVDYFTTPGSASSSEDYVSVSGTLFFDAQQGIQAFYVPIVDDAVPEADETLLLMLVNPGANASLGEPSTAMLTIQNDDMNPPPTNQPPLAADDSVTAPALQSVMVEVLGNDYDPNGDPIWIHTYTQGAHGSVIQSGAQLSYQSYSSNYCGPDSFIYTITDGQGGYDSATVYVTITGCVSNPPNQLPDAMDDYATVSATGPTPISVLANDSDPDFDPLSIVGYGSASYGWVSQSGSQLIYNPYSSNYCGPDSFIYTITDGQGGYDSATVYVTITGCVSNPPNQLPDAVDDYPTVSASGPTPISVLANDSDPDFDPLSIFSYGSASYGWVSQSGSQLIYNPYSSNYCGPDSFTYTITDGQGGYDSATVYVTITGCVSNGPPGSADVEVLKSVTPDTVNVGGLAQFYITVTNHGPDTASNVVIYEFLPPGLSYAGSINFSADSFFDTFTGYWYITNLPVGVEAVLNIAAQVETTGSLANSAAINASATADPNPTNNSASATVTGTTPQADLEVLKTVTPNMVNVGGLAQFYITVTNHGPDAASNVVIYESLPFGLSHVGFASFYPDSFFEDLHGYGYWYITNLPVGVEAVLHITARVEAPGSHWNYATITSSSAADPDSFNNTASAMVEGTGTGPQADLEVLKTVTPGATNVGGHVQFYITVTNHGPDTASNVVIYESLPFGLSHAGSVNFYADSFFDAFTGYWYITNLPVGVEAGLNVTAQVETTGLFENAAYLMSSTPPDPNAANDFAGAQVVGQPAGSADLQVTKRSTGGARVGENLGFYLTITNLGPNRATNIVVRDLLPGGLIFDGVGGAPDSPYNPTNGLWTVAPLNAGEGRLILIAVRAATAGLKTNVAEVISSSLPDPDSTPNNGNPGEDDYAAAVVNILPAQADLALTKRAATNSLPAGRSVQFAITLTNLGPDAATNIVVRDQLPPELSITGSNVPPGTTFNATTREWTIPGLASGAGQVLLLSAVRTNAGESTNRVFILSAGTADPNPNDNTNAVAVRWTESADLELSVTAYTNRVAAGEETGFTLLVTNKGPNRATNVTLKVTIPAGLQFVRAVVSPPTSFDPTNGIMQMPAFYPGQYDDPRIIVRAVNPGTFTLSAEIFTAGPADPDSTPNNNVAGEDDQSADAVTVVRSYSISGVVRECRTNGPPLTNITVRLTGTNLAFPRDILTATNGSYLFTNLWPGTYTVTPWVAVSNYTFVPTGAVATITTSNVTVPPFIGLPRFITGVVRQGRTNGAVLPGVLIRLSGAASLTNATDTNGWFLFTNLNAGSYTVTPLTNGFPGIRFAPTNANLMLGNLTNCTNTATFVATNKIIVLRALEAVQVIQDWSNNVPLVTAKPTLVRAHLQLAGTNTTPIRVEGARLHARDLNTGATASWAPSNGRVDVATNDCTPPPLRSNISTTLNFDLPETWRTNRLELRFEWTNGVVLCREPHDPSGGPSNCMIRVTFTNMPTLNVRFIRVAFTNGVRTNINAGVTNVVAITNIPTAAQIDEQKRRILSIYPISRLARLDHGYFFWSNSVANLRANEGTLLRRLDDQRRTSVGTNAALTNHIWYGVTDGVVLRGLGYLRGRTSHGNISTTDFNYQRHLAAHEIGHNLGRPHAVHSSLGNWHGEAATTTGRCDERADNPVEDFPMKGHPSLGLMPTLGPLAGDDLIIWGYDHYSRQVVSPYWAFSLMSYCYGYTNTSPWPWISRHTYTRLLDAISSRFAVTGGAGLPALLDLKDGGFTTYLLIRGEINLLSNSVELLPFYPLVTDTPPDLPPPGDFALRVVDEFNAPLLEIPFDPVVPVTEHDLVPNIGGFSIPVPIWPEARGVVILHQGVPIGQRTASVHPPEVQLLRPLGGEAFAADETVVADWQASDLDGDPLFFLVQYSPDGGFTWISLTMDWAVRRLEIPPDTLASTGEGLIRVIASDGFHFAAAQSPGFFAVANHAPAVAILRPASNELFYGEQTIVFEANANDLDDGSLSGTNVVWHSDRDGVLGTGAMLPREVPTLSEGSHVITVTVTDSSGATNSATVTIRVVHGAPPELRIERAGSQANILWPAATPTNWVLESSAVLPGTTWTTVTNTPVVTGDDWSVTVDADSGNRFFRLRKEP